MASTLGITGRAVQPDEAVLNGLKRFRSSLLFNTRRVLHWIVVQVVGVPVQTGDAQEIASAQPMRYRGYRSPQATIQRLVDDYIAVQFVRRLA